MSTYMSEANRATHTHSQYISDVASSNVSSNKINESLNNDTASGRLRNTVSDTNKDTKYWERRRRNNEAARRSREKRRMNDMNMDHRIMDLSERNKQLEQELIHLKMGGKAAPVTNSQIKKSKLAPITPAVDVGKDKTQTSPLGGMIFPLFTAIQPSNKTPISCASPTVNGFFKSSGDIKSNHTTDCSSFQGRFTVSTIPLLSNLIDTSNSNDDIAKKPTLLLSPFQQLSEVADQTESSDLQYLTTSDVLKVTQSKSSSKDFLKIKDCDIKTEVHDVLDLRKKNGPVDCSFETVNAYQSVFGPVSPVDRNSFCHLNNHEPNSADEPMSNSFLTGSVPKYREITQATPRLPCSQSGGRHWYHVPGRPRPSVDQSADVGGHLRARKYTRDHVLSLRSRLQIRDEVLSVVSEENSKLHEAIDCLSGEIKQLRSLLMAISGVAAASPGPPRCPSRSGDQAVGP